MVRGCQIVNKLRSLGSASNGMLAYDDQELRSRLITLENNAATRAEFFNKVSDKLAKNQLDQELKDLVDEMQDFSDILKTRYSKTESDQKYRFKEDKLTVQDLSPDLANNLKDMRDNLNLIKTELASLSFSKNELNNLKATIALLPAERLSKSAADQLYRQKKDLIRLQDIDDSLAEALRILQENSDKLQGAASLRDLRNYRLASTNISFEDLDQGLKNKIKLIENLNNDIEKTITNIVNNHSIIGAQSNTHVGDYQLFNSDDFQAFVEKLLATNATSVSIRGEATLIESIYSLYLSDKQKDNRISTLEKIVQSLQSTIQSFLPFFNLLQSLKNEDVVQHINQLYQFNNLKKVSIDSFETVSETNSGLHTVELEDNGTIIKANTLTDSYAEFTAIFKENATAIQTGAISNCPALMYLDIPSVKELPKGVIYNCEALTCVRLPSITKIADHAFVKCSNLSRIILPYDYVVTGKERFPTGAVIVRCIRDSVAPTTNTPKAFTIATKGAIANFTDSVPELEEASAPSHGSTPPASETTAGSSSATTSSTVNSDSNVPGA